MVERRLSFSADQRAALPAIVLPTLLSRALEQKLPLLEAQTRRAIGLANRDPSELSAAMAIWDRIGSPPNFAPARAARGLATGDRGETAAGLSTLKKLGDVNYVAGFAPEI